MEATEPRSERVKDTAELWVELSLSCGRCDGDGEGEPSAGSARRRDGMSEVYSGTTVIALAGRGGQGKK